MRRAKRAVVMILALVMCVTLVACGGSQSQNQGQDQTQTTDTSSAKSGELMGKPWVTSILQGNLPPQRPEAKDDLYTHYNYDYLAAHQEKRGSTMFDHAAEPREACIAAIKDTSKSGHDLDQLRIFFNQAADVEALKKTGMSEVQPYLDRINAVTSIKEMNDLLTAEDFPFSPFLLATISTNDTRATNIAVVNPNLVLTDPLVTGGMYYQDPEDPQEKQNAEAALLTVAQDPLMDLAAKGMDTDQIKAAFDKISAFEKSYAKYLDYGSKHSTEEFGAAANEARASYVTPDALYAACPNFPMKAMLDKLGKGNAPLYSSTPGWVEAFNKVWTDENIDVIKQIAELKVLNETRPYRDPSTLNKLFSDAGEPVDDAETFAYRACDNLNTFSPVLGNIYVSEGLGPNAKERLTKLSQDIVNEYKDLVGKTAWLGEESRARVIEKFDHMTLNVLAPTGGYYDYSGLELTPSDQGGTLMSNYLKLKRYRQDQESKMVGQPAVAASPWFFVKPTTANCFYDPATNSINILPGYVTSLQYTDNMDETSLLAGIGFSIGHEVSHGFDYSGAQYDAYGVPNPVFADADVDAFKSKTTALASYYKTLEIVPGVMVNGDNVVTEAAADLCGMQVVLELAGKTEGADYDKFFSIFANVWASAVPESSMSQLLVDNHTLDNHRVNVNSQMFDPIYSKLGVKEGEAMYLAPDKRINVWGPNA